MLLAGGWTTGSREANTDVSGLDDGFGRAFTQAAVLTAGVQLKPWLGVEGTVQLQTAQSFPWKFAYTFAQNTEELAKDRDIPVVGYVRFSPPCRRRICVEPVAGGGFNVHRAESLTTADCGPGSLPVPCVPEAQSEPSDTLSTVEWVFAAGVDFPVHVSPRVSIGPAFRLLTIFRRGFLFNYGHRGPSSGSGVIPTIGVSATWRSR